MINRNLLHAIATVAIGLLVALQAHAQGCPAGFSSTGDGFCIASGQAYCGSGMACPVGMRCIGEGRCVYNSGCYPEYMVTPKGGCVPRGSVICPSGAYCGPGERCTDSGGCTGGPPATGPTCAGGLRAPQGHICLPNGTHYNPSQSKLCGTTVCNIRDECGDNRCVSPFHQSAAMRAGSTGGGNTAPAPNSKTNDTDGQ